jgi:hypothetical protein
MAAKAQTNDVQKVVAAALDIAFYRAVNADVPARLGPVTHYCRRGWREGRDPAPWFSVADYLEANPDVRKARVEPFAHYLMRGRWEGREIAPSPKRFAYFRQVDWAPRLTVHPADPEVAGFGAVRAPPIPAPEQRIAVAREFDTAFYRTANPDVDQSGLEPIDHFMLAGWREGRDPHPRFSVRDYLEANPDVASSGLNPYAHFLIAGRAEGRAPRHQLGFRYNVIARSRSPELRLREAERQARRVVTSTVTTLAAGLKGASTSLRRLHLTFSHDDYVAHFGGVQLCLRRESERVRALGYDHLHLFPAAAWPMVRTAADPGAFGVLLNGQRLGAFSAGAVKDALDEARRSLALGSVSVAIHSLLGHAAEEVVAVARTAGVTSGYFWLHDFASLCAGVHLLRNDVEDCGAPPPTSAACAVCSYSPHRARHSDAHRWLFEALDLTVVAPAQTTLDLWLARSDLPIASARVVPHARLEPRSRGAIQEPSPVFHLAFLGMPVALKGWDIFRELAEAFAEDPRYRFSHLGGQADPSAKVDFHAVVLSETAPTAMQDCLEALGVDAALIWPLCRETFSFTAYEAVAGGAAVVTGPDSGNVAAFAKDPSRGWVLDDETALTAAFASGEICKLARARRNAQSYDLIYSGMTGDLLAEHGS